MGIRTATPWGRSLGQQRLGRHGTRLSGNRLLLVSVLCAACGSDGGQSSGSSEKTGSQGASESAESTGAAGEPGSMEGGEGENTEGASPMDEGCGSAADPAASDVRWSEVFAGEGDYIEMNLDNTDFKVNWIQGMFHDEHNVVWLGTQGVLRWDGQTKVQRGECDALQGTAETITKKDGEIWLATGKELVQMDPDTMLPSSSVPLAEAPLYVTNFFFPEDGSVWFGDQRLLDGTIEKAADFESDWSDWDTQLMPAAGLEGGKYLVGSGFDLVEGPRIVRYDVIDGEFSQEPVDSEEAIYVFAVRDDGLECALTDQFLRREPGGELVPIEGAAPRKDAQGHGLIDESGDCIYVEGLLVGEDTIQIYRFNSDGVSVTDTGIDNAQIGALSIDKEGLLWFKSHLSLYVWLTDY